MSSLRVAIIGAGYMAQEHLRAFSACSNVELVGIHSRSIDRAQQLAKKYADLKCFSSIQELWKQTKPDLAVIAVPELACLSVCEQAFQYNWSLLIEKPVGHTLKEALHIEQLANKYFTKAYVALNRRFYSSTLQLNEELNAIDARRVVTILDQEDADAALAAGQPAEVVNNWMFANSIHLIDYFSQLCRGTHLETNILIPWHADKPDTVIAQLLFSSGDLGLYQAVWNAPGPWSVSVSTPDIRGELRPIEQLSLQRSGSRQANIQPVDLIDQEFKPGLLRQAKAAIQAASGESTNLPTLAEANRSMAIVASIYGMS